MLKVKLTQFLSITILNISGTLKSKSPLIKLSKSTKTIIHKSRLLKKQIKVYLQFIGFVKI